MQPRLVRGLLFLGFSSPEWLQGIEPDIDLTTAYLESKCDSCRA